MARGLSKAAKAEAYDGLSEQVNCFQLVMYDLANGRGPEAIDCAAEPCDDGEVCLVTLKGFRLTGAQGGLVAAESWVERNGVISDGAAREVEVCTLDKFIERATAVDWYRSPSLRARYNVAVAMRAQRDNLTDAGHVYPRGIVNPSRIG